MRRPAHRFIVDGFNMRMCVCVCVCVCGRFIVDGFNLNRGATPVDIYYNKARPRPTRRSAATRARACARAHAPLERPHAHGSVCDSVKV